MRVEIELAQTMAELDEVYRLRHRVLVEEDGYLEEQPDGRIFDRFDACPGVATFTARVDGVLVGSIRVMESCERGSSADDYYDFRPYLRGSEQLGAMSHLVMMRAHRKTPGLTFSLVAMCYRWAIGQGLTHLLGAANPEAVSRFIDCGWKRVGEVFYDAAHGVWVQPALLTISELSARCMRFVEYSWERDVVRVDVCEDRWLPAERRVA